MYVLSPISFISPFRGNIQLLDWITMFSWFLTVKKSANGQTPLAEQPVHLVYQTKRAWKWPNIFLLRWHFLYRLLSRRIVLKRTPCLVLRLHMRNSTGNPIFSNFQSDLSRVAVSRPLVKGNEDAGYEGRFKMIRLDVTHAHRDSSWKFLFRFEASKKTKGKFLLLVFIK